MLNSSETLSAADFRRLAELIYAECGIHLAAEKQTMLEVRLRKRLHALKLRSCSEYCENLFSSRSREELSNLIDVVTTNKTDFFRENRHFEYLVRMALPSLARDGGGALRFWSAGCSTGEEPYTLAMVLSEYAARNSGFRFHLLATDISTVVLDRARRAVYSSGDIEPVPAGIRRKYLMRGRAGSAGQFRIVPELRALVEFRRLNFMDSDFGLSEPLDVIFCRNVIIYFDQHTRAKVLQALVRQLRPGGYLFLGHSETLNGLDVPVAAVGPTIYRKSRAGASQ